MVCKTEQVVGFVRERVDLSEHHLREGGGVDVADRFRVRLAILVLAHEPHQFAQPRQALQRKLVVAVELQRLSECGHGRPPVPLLGVNRAKAAPSGRGVRELLDQRLENHLCLVVFALKPSKVPSLEWDEGRPLVQPVDFIEQPIASDQFAALQRF